MKNKSLFLIFKALIIDEIIRQCQNLKNRNIDDDLCVILQKTKEKHAR